MVGNQLFDPQFGYFRPCPNLSFLEVDPDSPHFGPAGDRLHAYRFCGQFLGLVARHGIPVPAPLNAAVLKFLLGYRIAVADLEEVDPELRRHLEWVLAHPATGLDLEFSHTIEARGRRHEAPLGGPELAWRPVTDANKAEYVALLAAARATRAARRRLRAMREGFHDTLPASAREVLRAQDLSKVWSNFIYFAAKPVCGCADARDTVENPEKSPVSLRIQRSLLILLGF